MDANLDYPIPTQTFEQAQSFSPPSSSIYVFGILEERSSHVDVWRENRSDVVFIELQEGTRPLVKKASDGAEISMRRLSEVQAFVEALPEGEIFVDITGLSHHVWAPLTKVMLAMGRAVRVVYVEPASYQYSENPMKGEIFDLSEKIEGIEPIPQFAVLRDTEEDKFGFVALLGFEGARFAHVLEEVDPPGQKIYPIVGVPGFRVEYPFHSYLGNHTSLGQTRSWHNARFAKANCPFSVYLALQSILDENPGEAMKIALIGTKPHSLGAILFAIANADLVEIIYDHPKRKVKRTNGSMQCLVYGVSDFLAGLKAAA